MRRAPIPTDLRATPLATREALDAGLPPGRLRLADVAHPFHGVVAFDGVPTELLDRCRAYEARMRPGQFFAHRTVLRLVAAPLPTPSSEEPLDIAVFDPRTPPRARGVHGHRVSDVGVRFIHGLPALDPADAWCHAAPTLSPQDLVAVGDHLVSRRRSAPRVPPSCTLDELRAAAERHAGKRGAAKISWALPRVREGVDSRPETRLRLLLVAARLPEPVIGVEIVDAEGVLHPDLAYPEWRIAFDYEGDAHRTDRRVWMRDLARRERMEAAGWRVIRVTADDVFTHPELFVARVRRRISAR